MSMKTSCVAAVLFLALPALSQNLAMFRGSLQHTGVYDSPPVQKLTAIKWKFHTAGQVISSPAISGGTAYVGSTDGNLYAIDLASGAQKWKFPTEVRITSSPAVDQGLVYFGSFNGNFYAVTAADGKLKWKFHTAERRFTAQHIHGIEPAGESMPDPFDFYLSSPAVWNGAVYFGSGDGNVYALDAATGALKWKFQTGDVVHASPAISDGVLFVGSWDSYFYALDATTGNEKWRFKTGEDPQIHNQQGIQSSAAVAGGVVYFGCRDSNLLCSRRRNRPEEVGLQQQGFMGHRIARRAEWQTLFRNLRLVHVLRTRCSLRRSIVLSQFQMADVLLPIHCRRHALHRNPRGQAHRGRSQIAAARLGIPDRRLEAKRTAPTPTQRAGPITLPHSTRTFMTTW